MLVPSVPLKCFRVRRPLLLAYDYLKQSVPRLIAPKALVFSVRARDCPLFWHPPLGSLSSERLGFLAHPL